MGAVKSLVINRLYAPPWGTLKAFLFERLLCPFHCKEAKDMCEASASRFLRDRRLAARILFSLEDRVPFGALRPAMCSDRFFLHRDTAPEGETPYAVTSPLEGSPKATLYTVWIGLGSRYTKGEVHVEGLDPLQLKNGDALIFPSLLPWRMLPVQEGTRYLLRADLA